MSDEIRRALGRALATELARLALDVARELPSALDDEMMGTPRPTVKASPEGSDEENDGPETARDRLLRKWGCA